MKTFLLIYSIFIFSFANAQSDDSTNTRKNNKFNIPIKGEKNIGRKKRKAENEINLSDVILHARSRYVRSKISTKAKIANYMVGGYKSNGQPLVGGGEDNLNNKLIRRRYGLCLTGIIQKPS